MTGKTTLEDGFLSPLSLSHPVLGDAESPTGKSQQSPLLSSIFYRSLGLSFEARGSFKASPEESIIGEKVDAVFASSSVSGNVQLPLNSARSIGAGALQQQVGGGNTDHSTDSRKIQDQLSFSEHVGHSQLSDLETRLLEQIKIGQDYPGTQQLVEESSNSSGGHEWASSGSGGDLAQVPTEDTGAGPSQGMKKMILSCFC
jgi:hypothetical protein